MVAVATITERTIVIMMPLSPGNVAKTIFTADWRSSGATESRIHSSDAKVALLTVTLFDVTLRVSRDAQ